MEHTILPNAAVDQKDPTAEKLLQSAQYVLVAVFGLLPILFIPSLVAPFGYSKALFVVVGLFLSLILYSFSVLRAGKLSIRFSTPLLFLWALVAGALCSAVFSGDISDALVGNGVGTQTVIFLFILALSATVWSIFGNNKIAVMRLFVLLSVSTLLLALFHIVRMLFGADMLTLGLFQSATSSPLGGWNDVGIFFGLIIIISMMALQQLTLARPYKTLFVVAIVFGLVMLAVINFKAVWIILAFVSLITVMYRLSRGRKTSFENSSGTQPLGFFALGMSIVVLFVSVLFVISGSFLGGAISDKVGVSFIEVRPSLSATSEITKQVYAENALLGIGPNRFSDAWRAYKNDAINSTIFWATDFDAGIGYIPTAFITLGVLGGVLFVLFFGAFVVVGLRTFLRAEQGDRIWYFIGTTSFIGGLYLWGMAFIYVPGHVLLSLAALFTGLVIAAYSTSGKHAVRTWTLHGSGKGNVVLIAVVTIIMIGSIAGLYFIGNHYASVYTFNKSELQIRNGGNIDEIERTAVSAYNLFEDDRYARRVAEFQLARITNLLQVESPTEEEQTRFLNAVANGREAGNRAIALDSTDPNNWTVLGSVYYALVPGNVEGAYEEARTALERARDLDPHNPARILALARLELSNGNAEGARDLAQIAVRMKQDYRDAVFFLAQVQILLGDLDRAAESARGMTILDPQNPVHHFQLGVIETSRENIEAAVASLERAVSLDQNYANARYFLSINYDRLGRKEEALEQMQVVHDLNPTSALAKELLQQLERGESIRVPTQEELSGDTEGGTELPVEESEDVTEVDEAGVITEDDVDSPLISPVNEIGSDDGDETAEELDE